MESHVNRVGRAALPLAIAALILRLTLPPMPGPHLEISRACILCGERGIADAILNIALFNLAPVLLQTETPQVYGM